jgi:hypothetical protein
MMKKNLFQMFGGTLGVLLLTASAVAQTVLTGIVFAISLH